MYELIHFSPIYLFVLIHYLFRTAEVIISYLFIYLLLLYFAYKFIHYSFYLINYPSQILLYT